MPGEDNTIAHAQLVFGNGMIMIGTARKDDFGRLQQPSDQVNAVVTQSPYILVEDVDNHYNQAVKFGAKIVIDIQDRDYGSRDYSCRDPEGFLWNFGTYDPWTAD